MTVMRGPVFQPGMPKTKVLHLSDLHLDLSYTEGNLAENCGDVMCCTATAGQGGNGGSSARYWGEYTCDLPSWTAEEILRHIAEEHPVI